MLYDIKGARSYHRGEGEARGVGVQASDDGTLLVELAKPTGHFLHLLAHQAACPVPRHVVETYGQAWATADHIVTNGPFRLEEWVPDRSIVLARDPGYHGRCSGNVQRVELTLLDPQDWPGELKTYEKGGLDVYLLRELALGTRDAARHRHADEYVSLPHLGTSYLMYDVGRLPFDELLVRRAFALALDRETLADVVLRGYRFPATGGFVPPGMPGHSAGIALPYAPERARRLLAEAGYPEGHGFPTVTLLAPPGATYRAAADYQALQWRENLGVAVIVEPATDWAAFLDTLARAPPNLHLWGWSTDYPDPDNYLRVWVSREVIGWRNTTYEWLIDEATMATNQDERVRLYAQADSILVEEAPALALSYDRMHLLVKPWVSRYPVSPTGTFFWEEVVITPHE
jgi:oligopeptide transport system substrate-binding protein